MPDDRRLAGVAGVVRAHDAPAGDRDVAGGRHAASATAVQKSSKPSLRAGHLALGEEDADRAAHRARRRRSSRSRRSSPSDRAPSTAGPPTLSTPVPIPHDSPGAEDPRRARAALRPGERVGRHEREASRRRSPARRRRPWRNRSAGHRARSTRGRSSAPRTAAGRRSHCPSGGSRTSSRPSLRLCRRSRGSRRRRVPKPRGDVIPSGNGDALGDRAPTAALRAARARSTPRTSSGVSYEPPLAWLEGERQIGAPRATNSSPDICGILRELDRCRARASRPAAASAPSLRPTRRSASAGCGP